MELELQNTYDDLAEKLTSGQVDKDEAIGLLVDLVNPYIVRLAGKLTSGQINKEEASSILADLVALKNRIGV